MTLPDLKDSHRNQALKKLAEELAGPDTLRKLRDVEPMSPYLDPGELTDFLVKIEMGMVCFDSLAPASTRKAVFLL